MMTWFSIVQVIASGNYPTAVFHHYSMEPGGPTLSEVAEA
jgi:hypothetical protein